MKARLNITIDNALLESIKAYAASKQRSVSEIVEEYFKSIARPAKRKNMLEIVDQLEKPAIDLEGDLKERFYKEQAEKYGF